MTIIQILKNIQKFLKTIQIDTLKNNFKISIITVTKNSEKFLEENIKSLKERPWPPTWEMFEIGPDLEGLVETYRINLSSLITHLESNGTSVAEVVLSGDSKDEELVSKVIVQSMES